MRDIQPKRPKRPIEPPKGVNEPEARELYKKNTKGGRDVPISTIGTSAVPSSPTPQPKQAAMPSKVPDSGLSPDKNPSRPLFANTSIQKNRSSAKGKKFRKNTRLGTRERKVLAGFFVIILITAVLAAALLLPKADIELALQTAPLLVDQNLVLAQEATGGSNTIPASQFEESVEINGSVPVTSLIQVGGKASGTVEIVNRTTEEQSIKEQSRLVTEDGTLFFMQRHAIVPPASEVPSRVTVEVEAAEPGEAGNIQPQKLTFAALDSSAESILYAEATQTLTGGSNEEVKQVAEEDVQRANQAAQSVARSEAEKRITPNLVDGMTLLVESWNIDVSDLVITGEVGDEIDEITFAGTANVQVLAYDQEALQETLRNSLEEALDENYMLFPGEIGFTTSAPQIQLEDNQASFTARVTHTTIPTFSLTTLKEKLAGRSEAEAEEYLIGLPGVQAASVDIWPFWARNIPRIQKRITIELVADRDTQ